MEHTTIGCPNRLCSGGELWDEATGDFGQVCPTCHGYAFVWLDGTPIDSKPEWQNPLEYTTPDDSLTADPSPTSPAGS